MDKGHESKLCKIEIQKHVSHGKQMSRPRHTAANLYRGCFGGLRFPRFVHAVTAESCKLNPN